MRAERQQREREGGIESKTKAAISVAALRGKQWARDIGQREREREIAELHSSLASELRASLHHDSWRR